ncbi:MAG: oxidoreductase [Candidatus Jordarchaeum sp.]|uniref:oxidoreductase n=1 Tax=Candidatus Jordarchaeum sp. TaxID=2823881 RepID=UPI00404B8DA4
MARLFDSIKINSLKLRNRILMAPMSMGYADEKGLVTDKLIKHYIDRAEETGIIITGHAYVEPVGKFNKGQLGIYSNEHIAGLKKLTKAVHDKGTPIGVQISHAGGATSSSIVGKTPVAPSTITGGKETPKELTESQIEGLLEKFGQAAERAVTAEFDLVEIHGAHGFLLNQFVSPLTNRRKDKYGGSLENRIRFPLEVVTKIREIVGKNFPLEYRLGSDDLNPKGITIEDSKVFAKELVRVRVDSLDVSGGLCGGQPSSLTGEGFFIPQAETIKKTVKIVVIGGGGITTPEFADKVIKDNKVDMVFIGRAFLKEPKWAANAIKKLKK